ncbi:hypothetical protein Airi02_043930 [Actinoallomurus iriomotensis]|uniref:Uncharacterized protein n=1 Tax=Actinoallomurus iriomotensis TaxID=478107 RepID=A0A9W6S2Z9_9ACTN|nr:hypothetical protein Airi02_043930 [Actinoallomurus iriomotensis]
MQREGRLRRPHARPEGRSAAGGPCSGAPLKPADLTTLPAPAPAPAQPPSASLAVTPAVVPAAIEFDRIVPASGNMTAAGRQIWLGTTMAGQTVTVWVSATTLHVFHHDQLIKTHPVTLTPEDLAKLNTRSRPVALLLPRPYPPGNCPPMRWLRSTGWSTAAAWSRWPANRSASRRHRSAR